jgi:hypothetical protein
MAIHEIDGWWAGFTGTKIPLCETVSTLTTPTAGQSRKRSANGYGRT